MRCARPALIAPIFLGLLAGSGCYGPYQSSPYGPYGPYGSPYGGGGYPGVGGQPIPTLQPGGTYTPGAVPPSTFSPTPTDSSGGGAFYEPGSSATYEGGVPDYPDTNEVQDTFQFHEQQHGTPENTADGTVFEHGSIEEISATVTGAARVDFESARFVAPVPTVAIPASPEAMAVPQAPYAYDADYHWLRGILRFHAESETWVMTYSSNPAEDDPHAGKLMVADSPQLASHKPQAVVLLRGEVDATLSDAAGRAIYRVDAVEAVDLSLP